MFEFSIIGNTILLLLTIAVMIIAQWLGHKDLKSKSAFVWIVVICVMGVALITGMLIIRGA